MFQKQRQAENTQTGLTYDEGLRSYFGKVYNTMSMGLVLTGLTAMIVSNVPQVMNLLFGTPLAYVVMFAPMIFLMFGFTHKRIMAKNSAQLKTMFYGFCGVFGLSMSVIFLVYTGADIARAFFVTAAAFSATSVFGYVTKKDLSGMASFLFMGTIGLLIAMVVNMFLGSGMMDFLISGAGVLLYTLWTAFHTQQIKQTYSASNTDEANSKMAVVGALSLYIDFMMMFQFILSLMSGRD